MINSNKLFLGAAILGPSLVHSMAGLMAARSEVCSTALHSLAVCRRPARSSEVCPVATRSMAACSRAARSKVCSMAAHSKAGCLAWCSAQALWVHRLSSCGCAQSAEPDAHQVWEHRLSSCGCVQFGRGRACQVFSSLAPPTVFGLCAVRTGLWVHRLTSCVGALGCLPVQNFPSWVWAASHRRFDFGSQSLVVVIT